MMLERISDPPLVAAALAGGESRSKLRRRGSPRAKGKEGRRTPPPGTRRDLEGFGAPSKSSEPVLAFRATAGAEMSKLPGVTP